MIAIHRASEPGTQSMLKWTYSNAEVQRLLHEMVCVVACSDAFPTIESGPRKGKSSAFPTVTFEEHRAVFEAVMKRFFGKSEQIVVPQHLFLDPSGELILRKETALSAKGFVTVLKRALDHVDPGWNGPKLVVAKAGQPESEDSLLKALFSTNPKEQKRAVARAVAGDKKMLLRLYRQITSVEIRTSLLEEALTAKDLSWSLDLIRSALSDPDAGIRGHGARIAGQSANDAVLSDLLAALSAEKDEEAKHQLLEAVGRCGMDHRAARDALLEAFKGADQKTRAYAYVALGYLTEHRRVVEYLMTRGLKDRDTNARSAAVWALGNLRVKRAAKAIEKLIPRTRHCRTREFYREAVRRINAPQKSALPDYEWIAARRTILGERRAR